MSALHGEYILVCGKLRGCLLYMGSVSQCVVSLEGICFTWGVYFSVWLA